MIDNPLSQPSLPKPKVSQQHRMAPIWMLPILALVVGAWLVWRSLLDMGPRVSIEFDTGDGVVANQTQVHYKGIGVGMVKSLQPKDDLSGVIVAVQIDKHIAKKLDGVPKEARFWLVQPQVTLAGISGLNTIFSGNYIELALPADEASGEKSDYFVALKAPPPLSTSVPGLHIKFHTDKLGSVSVGSPIFAHQIQIGSVKTTSMSADSKGVLIDAHILPEYAHMVRKTSRFWNASGVRIDAGLGGLRVQTESLTSLLGGGISLGPTDEDAAASENGDPFYLYHDFEAAEAGTFINVQFPDAGNLIQGVTRVVYRGITVGKLADIWYDSQRDVVFGRFGIDPRFESFVTDKTRFWMVKPQLSAAGVSGLETLISGAYLTFTPDSTGKQVPDLAFVAADGPDPLDFSEPGLHLRLQMSTASSISDGMPVYYREFVVGSVQSHLLERDQMSVYVLIRPEYRQYVNRSSRFWNVSGVNISASIKDGLQIQSAPLASLITGGIAFDTPVTGDDKSLHDGASFTLHASEKAATMPAPGSAPGLYLTLETPEAHGITVGAPVLYRDLPVGSVQELRHSVDGKQVQVRIYVAAEHAKYLDSASRFWRASAVEMTVGGGGLTVRAGSLPQLMAGGVAFDAFDDKSDGHSKASATRSGDRFRLFSGREEAENAGVSVRLHLATAKGISTGSEIRYRGLAIGEITRLQWHDDMQGVLAEAALKAEAVNLLTHGTRFWQVEPAIGLARTAHLDSLLGSYLELRPGTRSDNGKAQREFTVVTEEPVVTARDTGLNLLLTAPRLGSLKAGDPLLYRQVKVGEVLGSELAADGKQVQIYVNLWPQHAALARTNSRFTNVSGMRVKAGLSGVKVDTESFEALLAGGIAFSTPEEGSEMAGEGARFELDVSH
jgi:paraquat-inducible protein B